MTMQGHAKQFNRHRRQLRILTAVGHNFRLVLAWMRILLRLILAALRSVLAAHPELKSAS